MTSDASLVNDARRGSVVTFYSFKGGVGRSMAVANVATILARDHGKDVIIIDWDLEAPGIHRFFDIQSRALGKGLIDYLVRYKDLLRDGSSVPTEADLDILPYLHNVRGFSKSGGRIRLLPAGDQSDRKRYAERVAQFDWIGLYEQWNGGQLLDFIRRRLTSPDAERDEAPIVLIDSRTGLTDISSICTLQMPDTVVLVFSYNDQNLEGIQGVAEDLSANAYLTKEGRRPPSILLLPTRKELAQIGELRDWEAKAGALLYQYVARDELPPALREETTFFREAAVPYVPWFSYGESLAAESNKGVELMAAYRILVGSLLRLHGARDAVAASRSTARAWSNPPPLRPASWAQVGFSPAVPVRWFQPTELGRTGVRAILAGVFGSYADRRELQAALHPRDSQSTFDYSDTSDGEIWLDYVADVGDGFNATYTIASLLARESLAITTSNDSVVTQRGSILIMGGDEAYPMATRAAYQNRTVGPYQAALPWIDDEALAPHLFAIPGNHDWYDGLTAFLRQFTQQRWIGGWRTRQKRSYFALRLPHRYWLWGTDIQLHADIDEPQIEYFRAQARQLERGDRVILCTAEPTWVRYATHGDTAGFQSLQYLIREIEGYQGETGAKVVLVLTGDSHHYARYVQSSSALEADGATTMYLTAGGGGAFLHGTQGLPRKVVVQAWEPAQGPVELRRVSCFPSSSESSALIAELWKFPFLHRGFVAMLAGFWCFLGGVLTSDSASSYGAFEPETTLLHRIAQSSLGVAVRARAPILLALAGSLIVWGLSLWLRRRKRSESSTHPLLVQDLMPWVAVSGALLAILSAGAASPLRTLSDAALRSPVGLLVSALALALHLAYVGHRVRWVRYAVGAAHACVHCLAWLQVAILVVVSTEGLLDTWLRPALPFLWLVVSALVAGATSSGIFALYLWYAGRYLPEQLNDVFAAIGSEDFKNFLRLHINSTGTLTVYPIGVRGVNRHWKVAEESRGSWIVPQSGHRIDCELIEPPLVFSRQAQQGDSPTGPAPVSVRSGAA